MNVYFDNAATTYPKPDSVADEVYNYIKHNGSNIGRGIYKNSFKAAERVYETRELICSLFNYDNPANVIFTQSVTYALNFVLKGYLKKGDHVLISSVEHNAVMRPINQLSECGIEYTRIPSLSNGKMVVERIEGLIKENTKAIIVTHASNVFGGVLPIETIGGICAKQGLKFIVDSAQTAGIVPIDMIKYNIDALCFTGHKGLYGPQGIGGFVVTEEMAGLISPIISGGTGSLSNLEITPEFCPDKFEAGTLNIPGIFGLNAGIKFVNEIGIKNIYNHEYELETTFLQKLSDIEGLETVGINIEDIRTSVVSVLCNDMDISELAFKLDANGIMTRAGIHCAPSAHNILGTFPKGTLRFSFGYFNTIDEVEYTIEKIKSILA